MLPTGVLLLEEIISSCGEDGLCAMVDAARRRFMESQQQKADGSNFWWRVTAANFDASLQIGLQSWLIDLFCIDWRQNYMVKFLYVLSYF